MGSPAQPLSHMRLPAGVEALDVALLAARGTPSGGMHGALRPYSVAYRPQGVHLRRPSGLVGAGRRDRPIDRAGCVVSRGHLQRGASVPRRAEAPVTRGVPAGYDADPDVLEYFVDRGVAGPATLRAEVRELPGVGRGLVAVEDIAPGELIYSVPYEHAIVVDDPPPDESDTHWAHILGFELLRRLRADVEAEGGAASSPWARSLPQTMVIPGAAFGEVEDLPTPEGELPWPRASHLADPAFHEKRGPEKPLAREGADILRQTSRMANVSHFSDLTLISDALISGGVLDERTVWTLTGVLNPEPVLGWAVALALSRAFVPPSDVPRHVILPGIDMANHARDANAAVSLVWGVNHSQGVAATQEIADVADGEDAAEFRLVAGPGGVKKGDEITLCYHTALWAEEWDWTYGFVPPEAVPDQRPRLPGRPTWFVQYHVTGPARRRKERERKRKKDERRRIAERLREVAARTRG